MDFVAASKAICRLVEPTLGDTELRLAANFLHRLAPAGIANAFSTFSFRPVWTPHFAQEVHSCVTALAHGPGHSYGDAVPVKFFSSLTELLSFNSPTQAWIDCGSASRSRVLLQRQVTPAPLECSTPALRHPYRVVPTSAGHFPTPFVTVPDEGVFTSADDEVEVEEDVGESAAKRSRLEDEAVEPLDQQAHSPAPVEEVVSQTQGPSAMPLHFTNPTTYSAQSDTQWRPVKLCTMCTYVHMCSIAANVKFRWPSLGSSVQPVSSGCLGVFVTQWSWRSPLAALLPSLLVTSLRLMLLFQAVCPALVSMCF